MQNIQYLNIHIMYYVSTCYIIQAEVAATGWFVCCHYQILDLQPRPSILHRHMQVSLGGCYHCLAQQGQQSLHEEPWAFHPPFFGLDPFGFVEFDVIFPFQPMEFWVKVSHDTTRKVVKRPCKVVANFEGFFRWSKNQYSNRCCIYPPRMLVRHEDIICRLKN